MERELRKENEMLKKSIMVLAVLALAMPAFAGDDVSLKTYKGSWPCVFDWKPVCSIKVKMKVGYYINIKNCTGEKVVLAQVDNERYEGCEEIEFENNFDLDMSVKIESNGAIPGEYSASVSPDTFDATLGGDRNKANICVVLKKAKIANADPNNELEVATVTIRVRPVAAPCAG